MNVTQRCRGTGGQVSNRRTFQRRAEALRRALFADGGHPDRVYQMYELGIVAAISNAAVAIGLTYVAWGKAPTELLLGWLTLVCLNAVYYLRRNGRGKAPRLRRISPRTLTLICVFAGLFALLWSPVSIGVLLLEGGDRSSATALLWVLLMGATVVYSAIPIAVIVYLSVALAPGVIYGTIWGGTDERMTVLAMLVLYVAMVSFSFRYGARSKASELRAAQKARALTMLETAHQEIQHLAETDPTTDLRNRRSLMLALNAALMEDVAGQAVLFLIDLDHFKHVNDAYGHDIGDAFLCHVSDRLRASVGRQGIVARLGGDEFAVLSRGGVSAAAAKTMGDALVKALNRAVSIEGVDIRMGASIGVAFAPEAEQGVGAWLNYADHALRRAKSAQRGTICFFEPNDHAQLDARNSLGVELESAVANGEIVPWYQPQISLEDGSLAGVEVLARWPSASGAYVPPLKFFELAESSGLVLDLCDHIFRSVSRDLRLGAAYGLAKVPVSINVHPAQLHHFKRLKLVLDDLIDAAGAPDLVTLEITENCIVGRGTEEIPAVLSQLASTGCNISLDDFGTGYASLTHIRNLPIHEVKIDRKFIQEIQTSQTDREIVRSILRIARLRNISVIAEGIETAEQIAILRGEGCEIGQGYYFARPMDRDSIVAYASRLARWRADSAV